MGHPSQELEEGFEEVGLASRVLEKTGASARAGGMFHKVVVQTVLLHGCETWTITDSVIKVLEGFHHRIARRISGETAFRVGDNQWECPPIEEALEEAGLWTMRECIRRRHASVEDCVATRPIHELCLAASPPPGGDGSQPLRWWQQDHAEEEDNDEED